VVLFILGRRLFRALVPAIAAAGLLCFELLHFVQSRTGMLDVFAVLFGLSAVLFIVLDRDSADVTNPGARPWRYAAGLTAAAAGACKSSGWLFWAMVVVLAIAWDARAQKEAGADHPLDSAIRSAPIGFALSLVVLPLLAYMLTYAGRLDGSLLALPWEQGAWIRAFVEQQFDMVSFHSSFYNITPIRSPAWSWILLKGPISYYYRADGGTIREIVSLGSPVVWWGSIPALLFASYRWLKSRSSIEGLILAGFALNYLVWVMASALRPTTFFFYALPAVPFMCLALANLVRYVPWPKVVAGALVAANLAAFVYFYPVVAAVALPTSEHDARIWFDECTPASVGTFTVTAETGTFTTQVVINADPPRGWCWGEGRPLSSER
jgi:dolichyl-phosphate-mannose--protein O-mannosyl transferase